VVNAVQPWLADENENFVRRLTKTFADFTYNIPPGATDLIVEIRAATTWWTEIAAFDNIRITAGPAGAPQPTVSVTRQGADLVITFTGGSLERTTALDGSAQWTTVPTTDGTYTITPAQQATREYFRAKQ
jgi:hypothetical protein